MAEYYRLGGGKQLNEIVMAGSHDAGITQGKGNAQTQDLNIYRQARAGVRLFDIRVAGAMHRRDGHNYVKIRAFHGSPSEQEVHKRVVGLEGKRDVVQSVMKLGTWGQSLVKMLRDAKKFVERKPDEFLILKFDKSYNPDLVAEQCEEELDDVIYKGAGNLNTKTLDELKGKVVVVFMESMWDQLRREFKDRKWALPIKNLFSGGSYDHEYDGLQYHGKGGTKLSTPGAKKSIRENVRKQIDRIQGGLAGNPNVMGMMYWTTTGLVGDIQARNEAMWKPKNRSKMARMWRAGLGVATVERLPANIDPADHAAGAFLKRFLPNFIMIDFANRDRCDEIFNLNYAAPTELTALERDLLEEAISEQKRQGQLKTARGGGGGA